VRFLSQPILIGFGHKARQGKDSAATFIHQEYPRDTKIYSFAAALRAVCRAVLGMREKHGPLLQLVGTEVFRWPRSRERDEAISNFLKLYPEFTYKLWNLADLVDSDEDVWARSLQDLIREDQPKVALITDMRFPNEAAIMDATIKVSRWIKDEQHGNVLFVAPDRPASHPSEVALDDYMNWTAKIDAEDGQMNELHDAALFTFDRVLAAVKEQRRTT
jgi:hypothetical protein